MNQTTGRLTTLSLHIGVFKMSFILIFAFIGFLFAVAQVLGLSKDYLSYNNFFDLVRVEGLDVIVISRFEPGFSIFAVVLTKLFTTNVFVFGWIIATCMLLKGWAISTYSSSYKIFLVVAAFYFIRYFPHHELTQLRSACAIALILVGAIVLWKGNLVIGLLICASSIAFHMSTAVVIPTLLLPCFRRWHVIFIAFVAFVLAYIYASFFVDYLGSFVSIVELYQSSGFGEIRANPFSITVLIDLAMIAVSLIMWNRFSLLMKRIVLLELIGMALFLGVIEFAVVAHRIRELYSIFWVLFVADGLQRKRTKLMSYGFVFVSIVWYSYVFVFSGNFNP